MIPAHVERMSRERAIYELCIKHNLFNRGAGAILSPDAEIRWIDRPDVKQFIEIHQDEITQTTNRLIEFWAEKRQRTIEYAQQLKDAKK